MKGTPSKTQTPIDQVDSTLNALVLMYTGLDKLISRPFLAPAGLTKHEGVVCSRGHTTPSVGQVRYA